MAARTELVRRLRRLLAWRARNLCMQGNILVACQPRPWQPSTSDQGAAGKIPDLVNRDFSAGAPGAKMVGDITYIPAREGRPYLSDGR